MNYLFLRLLTFIKMILGSVSTAIMIAYLSISNTIKNGAAKQIQKIKDIETKKIEDAKVEVIRAAEQVLRLEAQMPDFEAEVKAKSNKKINKIETKLK